MAGSGVLTGSAWARWPLLAAKAMPSGTMLSQCTPIAWGTVTLSAWTVVENGNGVTTIREPT